MSIPPSQDQVSQLRSSLPELFKSRGLATIKPAGGRVQIYTLLFGVVSGLTFSLASWGYEAIIGSQAHIAYVWVSLLVGTAGCVVLSSLAAMFTYWTNNTLMGVVFWILAAVLTTELSIALPLKIIPRLALFFEPRLSTWLPPHPYDDAIKTWIMIGFFSLGAFYIFCGLLQIVLVERAAAAATPGGRLAPYLFCVTVMVMASWLANNLANDLLRPPFINTNNLIQYALDNQGKTIDPTLARNMHLGSLNSISSLLDRPRRLFLGKFNGAYGQVEVLIDFSGTWASCITIYGQPIFCKTISSP